MTEILPGVHVVAALTRSLLEQAIDLAQDPLGPMLTVRTHTQ